MIFLFILLFFCVFFGANAYIYVRLIQVLPVLSTYTKILVGACMGIATCGVFLSIALHHNELPAVLSFGLFNVGAVWLVFLLYIVLALIVFDGIAWIGPYR